MMFLFGSHQILWTPTIHLSGKDSNGSSVNISISISKITVRYCGAPVGSEREYIFSLKSSVLRFSEVKKKILAKPWWRLTAVSSEKNKCIKDEG